MKSIKTIIQMKLHKKTSLNTQSLTLFTLNLKYQTFPSLPLCVLKYLVFLKKNKKTKRNLKYQTIKL